MKAWDKFLKQQEQEFGTETVRQWLRSLKVMSFDACNLYLEAKDSFQALWFEEHIRKRTDSYLYNNNNKRIKVHLSVVNGSSPQKKGDKSKKEQAKDKNIIPPFRLQFEDIDSNSTLESFVTSENSPLAYKLISELCSSNAAGDEVLQNFNPIFIYGGKGIGKTHLLTAATRGLQKQGRKVLYARAETFTEHVVTAIRAGEMQAFRNAYRNIDVLIIDNIHVLSRKSATQEEFFHTFNTIHMEGKLIILSANCSPQELKFIEPRLVSRFEWGIVISLAALNIEERKKILTNKLAAIHLHLDNSVTEFLISTFTSSPKALCRATEALVLRMHLDSNKAPSVSPNLEMVKQYLKDLIEEEKRSALTPEKIIKTVSEIYGIKVDDILGKSHAREFALPRQIAMFLCRSRLNIPYMKIGEYFSRDHSTVITSVRQIQKHIESKNKDITGALSTLERQMTAVQQ